LRITDLRTTSGDGRVRSEARVSWEETERAPATVFFEVFRRGDASIDPNAFVAGAAIAAFRAGERRIAIDGTACPLLRDGIAAVVGVLGSWYPGARRAPVVEPSRGFVAPRPPARRSGLLVSGGIDSLFSILRNRRELPADHPLAFREAIRVRHLMFPVVSSPERRAHIERRSSAAVAAIARDAQLEIAEVTTNVAVLDDDFEGYLKWTHGSVLASCALAAAASLTDVTISATHDFRTGLKSWGSHPLLDEELGTAAVRIRHEGIETSRLQKTIEIARWPAALQALYVCEAGPFPGDALNCGRCEKCVRTRAALLVAGIEEPPTFPGGRLRVEDVEAMPALASFRRFRYYWDELLAPLRAAGRRDLAEAIDRLARRQKSIGEWKADRGWKPALRRFDERLLGGALLRVGRRWIRR